MSSEQFWKFKDGPFRGLLFRIESEDAPRARRLVKFVQYQRCELISDELYVQWVAIEVA